MSLRRQHPWMLRHISAGLLFGAGMAALPAYLIQDSLVIRVVQVVLFGWLTVVAGKRLLWMYFLTILTGITFFHLLIPTGAVIVEVGRFPVTEGALRNGLFKGLTIIGMVFLSLVAVRADLRIPGRLGALVGKLFWSFEQIMERRKGMQLASPLRSADVLLLELYESLLKMDEDPPDATARNRTAGRSTFPGIVVVGVLTVVQWGALFLSLP